MNKLDLIERSRLRKDIPPFRPGDRVRVHVKVTEAGRQRLQVFEGDVIAKRGGGLRETFTVRKISFGVGVERVFPIHAPVVSKLEVVRHGKARRAKLYYLRELSGRKAKILERRTRIQEWNPEGEEVPVESGETPEASVEAPAPEQVDQPEAGEAVSAEAAPAAESSDEAPADAPEAAAADAAPEAAASATDAPAGEEPAPADRAE